MAAAASSSVRASRRHDHGYRELVEIDAPALIETLTERFPDSPVWIGGHSLGGQLSTLMAARQPDRVHGLLPIASGSVALSCYPPRLQRGIRMLGLVSRISGAMVGHFPGQRIGFGLFLQRFQAAGILLPALFDHLHPARHELREQLRQQAITDGLTGLFNRRHFMEQLVREHDRYARYKRPLSCMMVDLDYFKRINDVHGHLAGDAALLERFAATFHIDPGSDGTGPSPEERSRP